MNEDGRELKARTLQQVGGTKLKKQMQESIRDSRPWPRRRSVACVSVWPESANGRAAAYLARPDAYSLSWVELPPARHR